MSEEEPAKTKTPRSFSLVLVAAGRGERLGLLEHKAWVTLGGRPLWWHAAQPFLGLPGLLEVILVVHPEDRARLKEPAGRKLLKSAAVTRVVPGGRRRQDSVRAGVALAGPVRDVLIHDAARPFVSQERIQALLAALVHHSGVLLGQRVPSTVKRVDTHDRVVETLPRRELRLATTPQGVRRELLLKLLDQAEQEDFEATDEASLLEWQGQSPFLVEDTSTNFKVTSMADLHLARALMTPEAPRVGHGYDIHRLEAGGPLQLGGLAIPAALHSVGHSDGDALLHAIMEALLGAAGLPDIGEWFPDTDPTTRGIASTILLQRVLQKLQELGLRPAQVDCSIILEQPRLKSHKEALKASLQELLHLTPDRVGLKARSAEGLGPVGEGRALEVHCVTLLLPARAS